jgi:hypothetical protein
VLKNKLQPMLGCLNRLKHRMRRKGFPPDDRLLSAVCNAEDAVYVVDQMIMSCGEAHFSQSRPGSGSGMAATSSRTTPGVRRSKPWSRRL